MISLYDVLEASNGQLFGEPAAQLFADFSFDSRRPQEAALYVALRTERGDGHQYIREAIENGATGVLCTMPPTFDTDHISIILVRDVQAALSQWAQYVLKKYETHVIAVSGTSGTAVTSEAIRRVLSARYSVHYRPPDYAGRLTLPHMLAKLTHEHDLVILELDATQVGELSALADAVLPKVGVITDIGSSRLDVFGSIEAIAHEYQSLVERIDPGGLVVLNYADPLMRALAEQSRAHVLTVAIDEFGADLIAYNVVASLNGTGFDLRHNQTRFVGRWTPLLGRGQLCCLLRSLAVGLAYDISLEDGLKAIKELMPLAGHMVPLSGLNGSVLIDDSDDAEPETTFALLEWLREVREDADRFLFVMGDMDGLGPMNMRGHRMVGQQAVGIVDMLITEGLDAAQAGRAALDAGMDPRRVEMTHSPSDVVARLAGGLTKGDVVIVKGGASARMERVVRALLAQPNNNASLSRRDGADEGISLAESASPSWVEIDLDALAHNVQRLKAFVGPAVTLMAVVKANAYGAGAISVARTALLNGANQLGVASVNEALELREAGIDAPILILSYAAPGAVRQAIRQNLALTLYDLDMARAYDRAAYEAGGRLRIHIKIDTGMGRLGILPELAMPFFRHLLTFKNFELEGIYTHFASADDDPDYTAEQIRLFNSVVKPLRASGFTFKYTHAANSAGTLASAANHFNLVRVGIAMHGVSPSPLMPVPEDFRPVMAWKTFVAQVKTLPPGHGVGYGHTYRTHGEERIAVLPVGYSDGFRRGPANWGTVLIHGQRAPLVGRVSMEKMAINVTDIPDVGIGDEVVLLGQQGDDRITAEEVAERLGTIPYEVLCAALSRSPRR